MRKGRLLLADSHQNMLAGLRDLLKSEFESVFMVADEASLIEGAEKLEPDITVADLSLPVRKEINIVRRLKKAFPQIRLIILSVHDEWTAVRECLEAGAAGFVLKRTAVTDLVPAIEAVLKGEIYVSPLTLPGTEKDGENAHRVRRD
ncbi:MAG: response regulator transcription factor [Thermodesulfovibrionales bacterium]|jgi:DNA-binding NarL/FixJ family response regulator